MKRRLSLVMAIVMMVSLILPMSAFAADTEKEIQILTFNDFHGAVTEASKDLGFAKFVAAMKAEKAANPNTVIVGAGDLYQGSAMSNLTYGEVVTEMIKEMGMLTSAVGNHEFDWGVEKIEKWSKDGGFEFLASNIYDKATDKPVEWAKPYLVTEIDGVKVGFIGLATQETAYKTLPANVENLTFKDPAASAKEWVDYLKAGKAEEGTPAVIIALTHIPASQKGYGSDTSVEVTGDEVNALAAVDGINAIVSAHNHTSVAGYIGDVAVVEGYKQGRCYGKLSLTMNADGTLKSITPEVVNAYKTKDELTPDANAVATFKTYEDKMNPILEEVIGTANGDFNHSRDIYNVSELGRWVCEKMMEKTDAQIGFQNGGGLRTPIPTGDVTVGKLWEVMPFDNTMYTMDLTGAQVLENIEHAIGESDAGFGSFAGLTVYYDKSKDYGERVVYAALADGTPLDVNGTYKIVTNNFQASNGDNYMFKQGENQVDTYVPIRDMLIAEIKEAKTITPEVADYFVATDNYTIKDGDMLWKIAKAHGLTYQELAKLNNITNVNLIFTGNVLAVPAQ